MYIIALQQSWNLGIKSCQLWQLLERHVDVDAHASNDTEFGVSPRPAV